MTPNTGTFVAALRAEGIDALDLLVAVLVRASRPDRPQAHAHPLDIQQLTRPADPERSRNTVHQVPRFPFLLRGTLYDPADIVRFNGQDLHTIAAPGRDQLIVIDDPAIMNNLLQLTYLSSSYHPNQVLKAQSSGSDGSTGTTDIGITDFGPGGSPGGSEGPVHEPPGQSPGLSGPPRAIFYEDINYGGASLELNQGWTYDDLTEVNHGFLGLGGDWNDSISSIQTSVPLWTGLWQDVGRGGSSYANFGGNLDLTTVGWNDRASSVACLPW